MIKKNMYLIFIIVIILFMIFGVIFLKRKRQYVNFYNYYLKIDNFPEPYKVKYYIQYSSPSDKKYFRIMSYKQEDIDELKKITVFKKNDFEFENKVRNVLNTYFVPYFSDEEFETFKNYFDINYLNNESNYYTILEIDSSIERYTFELLIVDVQKMELYSIFCNYGKPNFASNKAI